MTPKDLYDWAVKNHAENAECFYEHDDYEYDVTFIKQLAGAGYDEESKRVVLSFGQGWCVPLECPDDA